MITALPSAMAITIASPILLKLPVTNAVLQGRLKSSCITILQNSYHHLSTTS
ncbi:MAG: hypothetical protein ABI237_08495 [Ginsengibacter sp.]